MRAALREGFLDATEIADWLAERGVPFRDAHHVSGRLVAKAASQKKTLGELSLEDYRAEHGSFDESIFAALDMETAVERRDVVGGPAKRRVLAAIEEFRLRLQ